MKNMLSHLMFDPLKIQSVLTYKHRATTFLIMKHLFWTLINTTNNIKSVGLHHFIHIISLALCKADTHQFQVLVESIKYPPLSVNELKALICKANRGEVNARRNNQYPSLSFGIRR